jgi:hypothetical protein
MPGLLQVAEDSQDVARGTLVEIHRQGQQLDKVEAGFTQVRQQGERECWSTMQLAGQWWRPVGLGAW